MKENKKYMRKCKNIYSKPAAMNMVEDDKKIWMVLLNRNGICEIDKEKRRARICKIFEEESLAEECLYCHVQKVEDRLIFSPARAKKIAVYDLIQDSIIYIPLKKMNRGCKQNQENPKFWNIIRHGTNVYLLGYSYPAIVKINMDSMETTYITDWVDEIDKNIKSGNNNGYFGDGYVMIDNLVFIPVGCVNAVLELNLDTDDVKLRILDISVNGIGGLSSADGKNLWIVGKCSKTDRAYCWNRQTENITEYFLSDEEENKFDSFYAPVCTASKVFFIPMSASHIHEFDLDTKKMKKHKILDKILEDKENPLWPSWKVMCPKLCQNHLIFISSAELDWYDYDILNEKIQKYHIYIYEKANEIKRYFDDVYFNTINKNIKCSEIEIPFEYFMAKVKGNRRESYTYISNNAVGKHIYEATLYGKLN